LAHATTVRQFQQLRIISKGTVMSVENYAAPSNAGWRTRGYNAMRVALAGLLLIAAALKAHSLATGYWTPNLLLTTPRSVIAVVELEVLLGLLLLSGRLGRAVWWAALLFFISLTGASLYTALDGQSSCGCLGQIVDVNPWWTFGLDVFVVVLLLIWQPKAATPSNGGMHARAALHVGFGAAAILAIISGAFLLATDNPVAALARIRGEVVTIEPIVADVGTAEAGVIRAFEILVTNNSDWRVRIVGGTDVCKCSATDDLPIIIEPFGSKQITIRMAFTGTPGRFLHRFHLHTDAPTQQLAIGGYTGRVMAH
jgi:hypothetical protein